MIVVVHTSNAIQINCGFPNGFLWLQSGYMCSLCVLFMNFYSKAYVEKGKGEW